MGLSYRVHYGVTYYWGYYDGAYTGWETRRGGEWTVLGVVSYSGTTFRAGGISQTTNRITLGIPGINLKYENDYFWNIKIPGVPPADGGDRFRTAAVQLQFGPFKAGINLFTGDPGLNEEDRRTRVIDGDETYIESRNGDNPDKYRAGVWYVGFGPFRIGRNSERVRDLFQNQIAHDWLTGSPHFRVLDVPSSWYFYFGTGTGNTLW